MTRIEEQGLPSNLHLYERAIEAEKATRRQRSSAPDCFEYSYSPRRRGDPPTVCPPGTVTIYFGRPDDPGLRKVRQNAADDAPLDRRVFASIRSTFGRRTPTRLDDAVDSVLRASNFLDVRYGDQTLARELFLPPRIGLSFVQLPWTGKALDLESIDVKEYLRTTRSPRLDTFVVVNPPPLTGAEKAALAKIPDDMRHLHVGTMEGINAFTPCLAVVAVVATVAAICVGRPLGTERISRATLAGLSSAGTIDELLQLRVRNLREP